MSQTNLFLPFKNPSNVAAPAQLDKQSNLATVSAHGSAYYATYNKNVFFGANPTIITTSAGLSTTYLGICLSNPATSTRNLAIRTISAQFGVALTTTTGIGLITGYTAPGITVHTTPLLTYYSLIAAATTAPQGNIDAACTLVGTPVWTRFLTWIAATSVGGYVGDLQGSIVLQPGAYMAIGTTIASPATSFMGSIEWEEINP